MLLTCDTLLKVTAVTGISWYVG